MVRIAVCLPGDWPKEGLAEIDRNETARSMQFVKEGKLKRIFRIMGRTALLDGRLLPLDPTPLQLKSLATNPLRA